MKTFTFGLIAAISSALSIKSQVEVARAPPSQYLFNDAEYLGQLSDAERCNLSTATRDTTMDLFVERLIGLIREVENEEVNINDDLWGYYTGEVNVGGFPHGEGVFAKCTEGAGFETYSGGFRDNEFDGLVTYRNFAGDVEVLEMVDGVAQGNATLYPECGGVKNRTYWNGVLETEVDESSCPENAFFGKIELPVTG